jgi:hypothetical protein
MAGAQPPQGLISHGTRTDRGGPTAMDHHIVFIAVGVALFAVVGYIIVMRIFYRDSAKLDKSIDYSKMKEWKDD